MGRLFPAVHIVGCDRSGKDFGQDGKRGSPSGFAQGGEDETAENSSLGGIIITVSGAAYMGLPRGFLPGI
jgi:hypothetical protein